MQAKALSETGSSENNSIVWIVILHYLGLEHTKACLNSLQTTTYPHHRILVLDNCSPDGSGSEIPELYPHIEYLKSDANLGFAGGCNFAAKHCIAAGAEWIWFLNNDTTVDSDSLTTLVTTAQENPDAGVLGAMVYDENGAYHWDAGIGTLDFRRGKALMKRKPQSDEPIACSWISGCNMLIRSSLFGKLRGFDEAYFLYWEDTDLCIRLQEAGFSCLLVPKAKITHIGNASTQGKTAFWRNYYHTRNRLLFFSRHAPPIMRPLSIMAILFDYFRRQLVLPFRGEEAKSQQLAERQAFRDWTAKRFGKTALFG